MRAARAVLFSVGGLSVFFLAFLVSAWLNRAPGLEDRQVLDRSSFKGDELGLVLIVSNGCAACNDRRFPEAWSRIVDLVSDEASEMGARLSLTAVVVSQTGPHPAYQFVERFGSFHELILGRGWDNLGGMKFMFDDLEGPGAVPQIVVFSRTVRTGLGGRPEFSDERIIQRRVGIGSVLRWAGLE